MADTSKVEDIAALIESAWASFHSARRRYMMVKSSPIGFTRQGKEELGALADEQDEAAYEGLVKQLDLLRTCNAIAGPISAPIQRALELEFESPQLEDFVRQVKHDRSRLFARGATFKDAEDPPLSAQRDLASDPKKDHSPPLFVRGASSKDAEDPRLFAQRDLASDPKKDHSPPLFVRGASPKNAEDPPLFVQRDLTSDPGGHQAAVHQAKRRKVDPQHVEQNLGFTDASFELVGPAPDVEFSLHLAEDEDKCDSEFDIEDAIFGLDESTSGAELASITPDENGLMRVGPQPMVSHDTVVCSAPQYFIDHIFNQFVSNSLMPTDAKLLGVDRASMKAVGEAIKEQLAPTFTLHRNDRQKRHCDYTGLEVIWTKGPLFPSFEAAYHFVYSNGRLAYHAVPNVCIIMASMNWCRRGQPDLVLPLLAAWMRAVQEPVFAQRKARLSWVYNAMSNTATMNRAFYCTQDHEDQLTEWSKWSVAKQRVVLEMLRTGSVPPELPKELRSLPHGHSVSLLRGNYRWSSRKVSRSPWKGMYEDIGRIAEKYGLTAAELDYHCTVASPKRGEPPVFYPYHILSRPQARQFGWDWPALIELAGYMLRNMRENCNRHGERAGYGEKAMDARRVVYWMAHHFCEKIRSLKARMGEVSWEEIAFHNLDRWDLPLVPWRCSCVRASLCKKQDHGIAMLFGLVCPEGEDFDPVRHFDLDRCTVTLDSVSTNMAMRDYSTNTWDSIRDALRSVPLHSVFWRVDPQLGLEIWNGGASDKSIMPQPPAVEFDVPLVSLDAWFVDSGPHPHLPYSCPHCPGELLVSPGELIHHCREHHSTAVCGAPAADHASPEQDEVDRRYWDEFWKCQTCGTQFYKRHDWQNHSCTKEFRCECGESFAQRGHLTTHVARKHTHVKNYKCDHPGCAAAFSDAGSLGRHRDTHLDKRKYKCDWEDCGKEFVQKAALTRHINNVHTQEVWYTCECGASYTDPSSLRGHLKKTGHKKKNEH